MTITLNLLGNFIAWHYVSLREHENVIKRIIVIQSFGKLSLCTEEKEEEKIIISDFLFMIALWYCTSSDHKQNYHFPNPEYWENVKWTEILCIKWKSRQASCWVSIFGVFKGKRVSQQLVVKIIGEDIHVLNTYMSRLTKQKFLYLEGRNVNAQF